MKRYPAGEYGEFMRILEEESVASASLLHVLYHLLRSEQKVIVEKGQWKPGSTYSGIVCWSTRVNV